MKPSVCELCGRSFDSGEGGGTVTFADYEPLPDGMTGHPKGCFWLCERHVADLEGSERIRSSQVGEAIQYRSLDRRMERC